MKKRVLTVFVVAISILLCSCADTRVIDIDNVIWKNEDFRIETTSEQLQKQYYGEHTVGDNNYYSIIQICGVSYSCEIYLVNNDFIVTLYDPLNDALISFYGDSQEFLWGNYDLVKEKEKKYRYTLKVELTDECQYYDYCIDNNIEYPNTIIFYGYENK